MSGDAFTCGACNEDVSERVGTACTAQLPVVNVAPDEAHAAPATGPTAARVAIQCSKGHWCEYICRQPGKGAELVAADVSRLEALQKLIAPEHALAQLDTFGKWLFGSVAIVGTLGAAFGGTTLAALQGPGAGLFGLAVAAVGFSLALATLALSPRPGSVQPDSAKSIEDALYARIRRRGWMLTIGGILFAVALVAASVAPMFSKPTGHPRLDVAYAIQKDSLVADIGAAALVPGTVVTTSLQVTVAGAEVFSTTARQVATDSGRLTSLHLAAPRAGGDSARIVVACLEASGCAPDTVNIPLPHPAPPR